MIWARNFPIAAATTAMPLPMRFSTPRRGSPNAPAGVGRERHGLAVLADRRHAGGGHHAAGPGVTPAGGSHGDSGSMLPL